MVPNSNYMPPSATPSAYLATESSVGDSSSAPQQDVLPPPHIYDHQAAKRLQQMMSDIRKENDHLTSWIRLAIKKELKAYFNNDEGLKRRSLTNIANRASPRSSKYTGGSATFMKTKSRLKRILSLFNFLPKSLDREATLAETFKYTHILKANKERFAEERSAAHYWERESGSETSVIDLDRVWHETASEPHKNHRFGLFFASGLCSFALVAFSSSTFATNLVNPQDVVDLREEVQKLTQELHQQAERSKQRYNDLLARVGGVVAISSNLMEKLQ
ncbi:hypothetical protein Ahy_A06g027644 [Arachis hypogaea]|uniref:Uncharacterized protein n=1 Tax=Arachis hypogaea TaxID=3818 RepID=A0A445CP99_ARAHY|nr:hypothetical protein Ahy_A06g027644 [Arachis hypogaea]